MLNVWVVVAYTCTHLYVRVCMFEREREGMCILGIGNVLGSFDVKINFEDRDVSKGSKEGSPGVMEKKDQYREENVSRCCNNKYQAMTRSTARSDM
jgi:hypothetical protein